MSTEPPGQTSAQSEILQLLTDIEPLCESWQFTVHEIITLVVRICRAAATETTLQASSSSLSAAAIERSLAGGKLDEARKAIAVEIFDDVAAILQSCRSRIETIAPAKSVSGVLCVASSRIIRSLLNELGRGVSRKGPGPEGGHKAGDYLDTLALYEELRATGVPAAEAKRRVLREPFCISTTPEALDRALKRIRRDVLADDACKSMHSLVCELRSARDELQALLK